MIDDYMKSSNKIVRKRGSKPEYQIKIAKERIKLLFEEAAAARNNPERARSYIKLARKIGMRYNVRIPHDLKILYCKNCYAYLLPSKTRLKKGTIRIKCFSCNKAIRHKIK